MDNKSPLDLTNINTYDFKGTCKTEDEELDYKDVPDFVSLVKQEILDEEVPQPTKTQIVQEKFEIKNETNDPEYSAKQFSPVSSYVKPEAIKIEENFKIEETLIGWDGTENQNSPNNIKTNTALNSIQEKHEENRSQKCHQSTAEPKGTPGPHKRPENIPPFRCNLCNFQTMYKRCLKRHLLRHKNPDEVDMFQCDSCNYKTIQKADLKKHVMIHGNLKGIDKFKCDQCAFETIHKHNFKIHLLQHSNPKEFVMFKCTSCDYQTSLKALLNRHLLKHKIPEEVKTFKCDHCIFQTNKKSNLMKHLLRHKDP